MATLNINLMNKSKTKYFYWLLLSLFAYALGFAQDISVSISSNIKVNQYFVRGVPAILSGSVSFTDVQGNPAAGYVLDKGTGIPLAFSNIFLEEHAAGAVSDSLGFFEVNKLCRGDYHIRISHIGCEQEEQFITKEELVFDWYCSLCCS